MSQGSVWGEANPREGSRGKEKVGNSHSPRGTLGHLVLDPEVFGQNLHPGALGRENSEGPAVSSWSAGRLRKCVGGMRWGEGDWEIPRSEDLQRLQRGHGRQPHPQTAPHPTRAVSPPHPGWGASPAAFRGPGAWTPTCFRMMSVACIMHLGSSPWLRARMAACSRERLRVLLKRGGGKGEGAGSG